MTEIIGEKKKGSKKRFLTFKFIVNELDVHKFLLSVCN